MAFSRYTVFLSRSVCKFHVAWYFSENTLTVWVGSRKRDCGCPRGGKWAAAGAARWICGGFAPGFVSPPECSLYLARQRSRAGTLQAKRSDHSPEFMDLTTDIKREA